MASRPLPSIASPPSLIHTGSRSLMSIARAVVDPILAVVCLVLSCWIWGADFGANEMVLAALTFALMYPGDLPYRTQQRGVVTAIAGRWGLILGVLLMIGLLTGTLKLFDQDLLATWIVTTAAAQMGAHLASPWIIPRLVALRGEHVAVVVGANSLGRAMARSLMDDPLSQTRVTAYFDDRSTDRIGSALEAPVSGGVDKVADFVRANHVDQIFIALPMASQPRILKLLDQLRDTTASIYFLPDIFMYDLIQARMDTLGGMPVVAVCETPFHGTRGVIKRLSDVLIGAVAVAVTAPVMLAVAAAIKMTMPGPVLFKQRRYGLDGEEIVVWKFRSMKVAEDGAQIRQATRDDDRITPLGRFLRRTSLDELPQFVNVLQGRMSIVGPRPHAVAHNETYRKLIKGYMIRHKVKPGVTGWAQVNGARGETDTIDKMERRIDLDLQYLRNWSLRLDLLIVAKTVWQAVRGDRNAY